jgi:parvulin-like peptidyl-prolyl isomerase
VEIITRHKLKKIFILIAIIFSATNIFSQRLSIAQIKKILDTTSNPVGFVKFILKKKFFIDTIAVASTSNFIGKADSLAYKGKTGKTYGPFKEENILVKILLKAPNTFYHVQHILIDTSLFQPTFADSLADNIIGRLKANTETFATLANKYSADYSTSAKSGDLGWFVQGVLLPQLDVQLTRRKKGEVFKVWSPSGLHVIKIIDNPKKDVGFALMLRVIL